MGRALLCVCLLLFIPVREISALKIRNKLLGKCLQVQEEAFGGRVSLGECRLDSPLQEWRWHPESQALSSHHTGECLTAPREQYEGVHLQPCIFRAGGDQAGDGVEALDMSREANNQAWACSKKGHLTLIGRGLHLNAAQESTLVFLSREHKQGSRWRTLDNQTLCNGRDGKHHQNQPHHHQGESLNLEIFSSDVSDIHRHADTLEGIMDTNVTEPYSVIDLTHSSLSTKSPPDHTMIFFDMVYGMGWKITMLVLSSLALLVGIVILIVNVYSNRRKKVVCVLKSYTPRPELSAPGSPGRSETAPLTEHAMRLPYSSPTLQQGEILIEWKDGTVTPLYEA